tara:strand:- start:5856 stop:7103 length:1248 start_codon:yes stop_codon:yes gene_type:complete
MKKITIIGGGITGCLASLYFSKLGFQVEIFEKKKSLGGVINDFENDNDFYFNGPNYFNCDTWWIKELESDSIFKDTFSKFRLRYGSFNDLFDKDIFYDDYAQIVSLSKFSYLDKKSFKLYDERINCYQTEISEKILNWSKKFCKEHHNLHSNCALLMNTGRIYFPNDKNQIIKLKKESNIADEILGVPNSNYSNQMYCVPKFGFKNFFEKVEAYLKKKKITINLNSNITIQNNCKVRLFSRNDEIEYDHVIWCASPVLLLKKTNIGDLDNPVLVCVTVFLDIESNEGIIENKYIQVFSKKFNLFRIFIYELNKKTKLSLEIFQDKNIDIKAEIKFAIKILNKMGFSIKKYIYIAERREFRHMLFTLNDLNKIKSFENKQSEFQITSGGWLEIGRENKINHIIKNVNKCMKLNETK